MPDKRFFKPEKGLPIKDIAMFAECKLDEGIQEDFLITNIASLSEGQKDEITFFDNNKKMLDVFYKSNAGACIVSADFKLAKPEKMRLLFANNPQEAFVKIMNYFYKPQKTTGVSEKAEIHKDAKIGKNCCIEAGVVIEGGVEIGDNCTIGANTVIRQNVVLGDCCNIFDNVTISYAVIGKRVTIYSGARIGQDGFGYVMRQNGHIKIPQLGRVIIGDDVDIGANTTIDRGALDDTTIGNGCKIDNLIQIAHNVKLGCGCVLAAQVGISGSTRLGNLVAAGGQVGFADHINVGDGAKIAAQSGVMRDIEPMEIVMGSPALPIKEHLRHVAYLQKITRKK